MGEPARRRERVRLTRRPKAPSRFIAGRPQRVSDPLVPLRGRGFSIDQPAPGSRRHIPVGSPEPPPLVRAVTILEQAPERERWERITADQWLHLGTLTDELYNPDDLMARLVPWARVGVCREGTAHDLKDITDRLADWADRATDGLPEIPHVVYLRVDPTGPDCMKVLRSAAGDVETSGDGRTLRFERYAPTMPDAVRTATTDAEFAGFVVTGIQAG